MKQYNIQARSKIIKNMDSFKLFKILKRKYNYIKIINQLKKILNNKLAKIIKICHQKANNLENSLHSLIILQIDKFK